MECLCQRAWLPLGSWRLRGNCGVCADVALRVMRTITAQFAGDPHQCVRSDGLRFRFLETATSNDWFLGNTFAAASAYPQLLGRWVWPQFNDGYN